MALASHGTVVKEVWDLALQTARDEYAKHEATHPDMRQSVKVTPNIRPQHTMVETKIRTALFTSVSEEIRELALAQQKTTTAVLLFELTSWWNQVERQIGTVSGRSCTIRQWHQVSLLSLIHI